ncbi:winged helix-turn-helix domain-containing protein [Halobaculum marinum]|uniref:Winged helix-turn-helix domain-containing protein n=1 Tax=Halobaculum marinum TaxID=3031996 RepID=A0ABD5X1T2_9EURY|nr:ArsR family transcriptional regulator [Halobaculum sp. DT55]
MSDSDEPVDAPVDTAFDPAAAFALLGDDTRLRILRALWEAQRDDDTRGTTPTAVPFERLRERAGVDDSGRFNYHLGKLTDRFVERVDEGYRLRFAGTRVVGALLEGTYAPGADLDVPAGGTCHDCGGPLDLTYADERARVACRDCDHPTSEFGCPPGVLAGRDPDDLPAVVDTHLRTLLARARRGICPTCSGPTAIRVHSTTRDPFGSDEEEPTARPIATVACQRCGEQIDTGLVTLLVDRPVVVAFLHERGVDPEARSLWVLLDDVTEDAETVSAEPYRATATYRVGDDTLTVTVDAEGAVVGVEEETA